MELGDRLWSADVGPSSYADDQASRYQGALLEQYKAAHEAYCKELEAYCTKYAIPFFRTHTSVSFDQLVLKIFRSGGFLR